MKQRIKLKRPASSNCATQCRQMGLAVGDTIIGREGAGDWWCESALTIIFLGKQVAVFKEKNRTSDNSAWKSKGESSNWTLDCRIWHKVVK